MILFISLQEKPGEKNQNDSYSQSSSSMILPSLTMVYTEKDMVIDHYFHGPTAPKLEGSHTEVPSAGNTIRVLLLTPH